MTALELKDVSISIADTGRRLVADLNLKVEAGSVTTLMGPSGSGKSSLLAFIAGISNHHCGAPEPRYAARSIYPACRRNCGKSAFSSRTICCFRT